MTNLVVRDRNSLELAYVLMKFAAEHNRDDMVKEYKRSIRKYLGKPVSDRRIINSDFDGGIVILPLPAFVETYEEAREWFMENEYMSCRPSMYDCTGQMFTAWYKLFRRNGKFWAYHCFALDV